MLAEGEPLMSADELVLAIDQGTSVTKVVAFDLRGRPAGQARAEIHPAYPAPGRAESDPEEWWRAVAGCIRQVLADGGIRASRIKAAGICGFMHTLVPVDAAGMALHQALLWADQRCAPEVEELAPYRDLVARVSGRPLSTQSSLPRLRWLRSRVPLAVERAATYLLVKDVLRFRLTGEAATDRYDAWGTGLTAESTEAWSEQLLELAGVGAGRMPPILRPDAIAGYVTAAAAAETGLAAGTPVVTGSGDWFSTILGSGCFLPERTCFYLGSAGIIGSFASREELDRLGETRYFGSVTSTGTALRWLRDLLYPEQTAGYAALCEAAERSRPGARGLLFLPHLLGERGGTMRPGARGTLHGLTLANDRADVARAVLEGTALWLRATCEPMMEDAVTGDLVAHGGGAQSPLWRRICAAVFGRRLLVPETGEAAAMGVAMMAAVGCGLAPGYAHLAGEWARMAGVEEPDPELISEYDALYERFRDLEGRLLPLG
jgi:xylulokinase